MKTDITGKVIYGADQIGAVANQLFALRSQCQVYTFQGPLGAGKTTLVRQLLRAFGVTDTIVSPTFTYVTCYTNEQRELFYHFDLYRITSLDDFYQLGFDEYLYAANSWSFVEWPELIMPMLDHAVCHIQLDYTDDNKRIITYRVQ